MFIDLRGFTKLAATLEPQALIALLGEYQRVAVPIIQRHRGSITTYLGDGIMVTFGAIGHSATYAADALRCAEALLDALGRWGEAHRGEMGPGPGVGIGVEADPFNDLGPRAQPPIGAQRLGRLQVELVRTRHNRGALAEIARAGCSLIVCGHGIGRPAWERGSEQHDG